MTATASTTLSEFCIDKPIADNGARARPASRGFARSMLALCIGVAATLAWQSYGPTTQQIFATRALELGWSRGAKQTIASWLEQLGWTKRSTSSDAAARPSLEIAQAATVAQTAPDKPAASIDPEQIRQMALDVAALRQSVDQVLASQAKMAGEIDNLLVTDMEIFLKVPIPPHPPAARVHRPVPAALRLPAPNRRSDVTPHQSLADTFRN